MSNNIAEGFERGTTAELLSFLYIARGSAGEVRSMLLFCERLTGAPNLKSQISDLKSQHSDAGARSSDLKAQIPGFEAQIAELKALAESCSRQIHGWADQLQNSDIQGQRRLTEKSRQAWQADRRAEAVLQKLQDNRDTAAKPPGEADAG